MLSRQPEEAPTIDDRRIEAIAGRVAQGLRVRRSLPPWGRIHVDRPLPFLVVYRRPAHRPDAGTARLITGAAAYVAGPADGDGKPGLPGLVEAVAGALAKACGGALVVEIWTAGPPGDTALIPAFEVRVPRRASDRRYVSRLRTELETVQILKRGAEVRVQEGAVAPPGMRPLLSPARAAELGVDLLGLEVAPVHQQAGGSAEYPLVRRALKRQLTTALGLTFFEYARTRTELRPRSYQTLGRRAMVKAVWDADRALADIARRFDLLLLVTPTNVEEAWARFRRGNERRPPTFLYRPISFDPAIMKRRLFSVHVERIEDPTLAELFRRQRATLDRQLSLLAGRETSSFVLDATALYDTADDDLLALALGILARVPPQRTNGSEDVDAAAFARAAEEELGRLRTRVPDLDSGVELRADVASLMVSHGKLLVGSSLRFHPARVEALIQHEIGTHVVTAYNGRQQPLRLLASGLGAYESLQEGLGVLAEYAVGGLSASRLRMIAGRAVAVRSVTDGASFLETYRRLTDDLGFSGRTAFLITTRVHRGGGFTKDAVYLRGLQAVVEHLASGGELEPLLVGKIAIEHAAIVDELLDRGVLKPAALRPSYLDDPGAQDRLAALGSMQGVEELVHEVVT